MDATLIDISSAHPYCKIAHPPDQTSRMHFLCLHLYYIIAWRYFFGCWMQNLMMAAEYIKLTLFLCGRCIMHAAMQRNYFQRLDGIDEIDPRMYDGY